MQIFSLIKDQYSLKSIEVEVSCVNGSPDFEILGQADSLIKEAKQKIYSSFRHQQFEIPNAKKIFVNLKPGHIKKSSQGLDLAIALGILWETGQLPKPQKEKVLVYGELGLEGDIHAPDDFRHLTSLPEGFDSVYTGSLDHPVEFDSLCMRYLRDYPSPTFVRASKDTIFQTPPKVDEIFISKDLSLLIQAICIGEHPSLFAGPKGSGKSTIVENIPKMLRSIEDKEFAKLRQIANYFHRELNWRPIISPHHTTTALAMVGGGSKASPGEFTRAHGGSLIMDEFLEFHPYVQEALREPMQTGKINISRVGGIRQHPADFLLLATTNLCPCGEYFPSKKNRCYCRLSNRRKYIEKLSGPVLDRFHVLSFSDSWMEKEDVYLPDLQKKIQKIIAEKKLFELPNAKKNISDLMEQLENKNSLDFFKNLKVSRRRKQACLQLARSFSDIDQSELIRHKDIELAMDYCFRNFENFRLALSKEN